MNKCFLQRQSRVSRFSTWSPAGFLLVINQFVLLPSNFDVSIQHLMDFYTYVWHMYIHIYIKPHLWCNNVLHASTCKPSCEQKVKKNDTSGERRVTLLTPVGIPMYMYVYTCKLYHLKSWSRGTVSRRQLT